MRATLAHSARREKRQGAECADGRGDGDPTPSTSHRNAVSSRGSHSWEVVEFPGRSYEKTSPAPCVPAREVGDGTEVAEHARTGET